MKKDMLSDLLMFHSSHNDGYVTLKEYKERMKEDQKEIFYCTGSSIDQIKRQPQIEKLLDKGDMLFHPVGKPKPIRVQGAFVSDKEVEDIMDHLKQGATGGYDSDALEEINRAAQKCIKKKDSGSDYDDEDDGEDNGGYYNDRQFLDAVEIAVNSGKISTSLIQRKLSIGYGKAAKFIDVMESIGIVSEPNGQKPREVLITKDEWIEKLSRVNLD